MRATVRHHETLAVPADRAWAAFTRPELLDRFFPGIAAISMNEAGDVRSVTLGTGLTLDERIIWNDDIQRRLQYRIEGSFFRDHLATVDVLPLDDDRCLIAYASDCEPATMAIILGGAMRAALDSVKQQLESDEGPLVEALADGADTTARSHLLPR